MVSIKAIQAANKSISIKNPTAIFIGATSGIGLGAIKALLQNTKSPKIFIIGRSETAFKPTIAKLQDLNPSARIIFIEAQVSLLKEVDRICSIIKSQESAIDMLWLSQGGLSMSDHESTSEGLNFGLAVKYYSRILFMYRLLSLLSRSPDPRIISILSAGQEDDVNISDLGLSDSKNYRFWAALRQGVTMMSLAMREMALQNSRVSFIHTNPGLVSTAVHQKWADSMTGYLSVFGWLLKWTAIPIFGLLGWTPEEAGQIGIYELTNERYSASTGENLFRLGDKAEDAGSSAALSKYVGDGTQEKVWEHTLNVFDKVLV